MLALTKGIKNALERKATIWKFVAHYIRECRNNSSQPVPTKEVKLSLQFKNAATHDTK